MPSLASTRQSWPLSTHSPPCMEPGSTIAWLSCVSSLFWPENTLGRNQMLLISGGHSRYAGFLFSLPTSGWTSPCPHPAWLLGCSLSCTHEYKIIMSLHFCPSGKSSLGVCFHEVVVNEEYHQYKAHSFGFHMPAVSISKDIRKQMKLVPIFTGISLTTCVKYWYIFLYEKCLTNWEYALQRWASRGEIRIKKEQNMIGGILRWKKLNTTTSNRRQLSSGEVAIIDFFSGFLFFSHWYYAHFSLHITCK